MSHGSTEHNLEEAHHAEHASHDNFTRNVAMTMAILAAGLAFVTLLSHRQHTTTLQLEIESNDNLTEASDKWSHFQAKKNRLYMNQALAELLNVTTPATGKEGAALEQVKTWRSNAKRYETESKEIETEARGLGGKAADFKHQAHASHFKCNFFDAGHLGLELALVICSLAVLTRKSMFWFAGIGIGALGLAVALSGFVVPSLLHDDHAGPAKHDETQPPAHQATEQHGMLRASPSRWELPGRG